MTIKEKRNGFSKTAKKAVISDFEKSETRKVLDQIVENSVEKSEKTVAIKTRHSNKRIDFAKKPSKDVASVQKVATNKLVPKNKKVSSVRASRVQVSRMRKSSVQPHKKQTVKEEPLKKPLVSVIIPVRNRVKFIDSTIHSVLGQTFQDFELIIVDDSSDDGTFEIVKEFLSSKIKVVSQEKKTGIAKARNRGVEMAQGRYICFLSMYDMWQPEKLERQIEFMREKGRAFSFTGYVFADVEGVPTGKAVRVPTKVARLQRKKVSAIPMSTVMFDMSKLTKDDIMMPDTKNSKKAIWKKALKKASKAYGLNEVLAIRGYDDGASLIKKMWRRV